jgi:hypothetical protein
MSSPVNEGTDVAVKGAACHGDVTHDGALGSDVSLLFSFSGKIYG